MSPVDDSVLDGRNLAGRGLESGLSLSALDPGRPRATFAPLRAQAPERSP